MTTATDFPTFGMDNVPAFFQVTPGAAPDQGIGITSDLRMTRRAKRRQTRHLLEVSNAAQHLAALPEADESLHCVMRGNYHAWDLVPAVARLAAPATIAALNVATLGFNRQNAFELIEMIDAGTIGRCTFICSCYYRSNEPQNYGWLAGELHRRGHQIASIRCHAKLMLFELTDGRHYAIESSANLRSCRNIEQFSVHADRALVEFHRAWMLDLLQKGDAK